MTSKSNLTHLFGETADARPMMKDKSPETTILHRPPIAQRASNDLRGDAMRDYINGLESRLINHIRKHSPCYATG